MLPFFTRGGETLPTFSSEKSKKSTYFAQFLNGNYSEPLEKLPAPLSQSVRTLREQTQNLRLQNPIFDLPRHDEMTKKLSKSPLESNEMSNLDQNGTESHRNSPILSMLHSSSLLRSQTLTGTCFSENMSDHLDANSQDVEISSNPTMRAAATATAPTASQTTGTQPSIL